MGERELPRILDDGLTDGSLDYYSEYIDRGRFPDPQYRAGLRDFLQLKYKGQRFDLIIAMQDLALEFIGGNRNELFPDTPVVSFATADATRRIANSTGLIAELDFSRTIALATELQPDIRRVFVVSGADPGSKEYEVVARKQFRQFEPRFEIVYLSGLPTNELETRLSTLPGHSMIYYLVANQDGAGQSVHPLEYLDRLAAIANAPIYCWVDSAMDHGIVGGSLKSQKAEADAIGSLALRVLGGEQADSIPVSVSDLNVRQVDWRQLKRWGISEARVPAGTLVRFRQSSVWESYKIYILGAIGLVLAQTALIAGLLVHRTRRRQAEEQVRGGQAELRTSYERIRDLGSRLLNAQETERSRIARELHDDISQQVAVLAIDLELLGSVHEVHPEGLAEDALNRAHDIARSVHDLSHRLHPAKLRLIGLVAALQGLQTELSRSDVAVTFTHDNVPVALPPDLMLCLFRLVQEALQNAIKHSGAGHISVHLAGVANGVALTIVDDGSGFDVDAAWGRGLGLISMAERLEAMGGTLEIHSRPNAGTRVAVRVPVLAAPDAAETVLA